MNTQSRRLITLLLCLQIPGWLWRAFTSSAWIWRLKCILLQLSCSSGGRRFYPLLPDMAPVCRIGLQDMAKQLSSLNHSGSPADSRTRIEYGEIRDVGEHDWAWNHTLPCSPCGPTAHSTMGCGASNSTAGFGLPAKFPRMLPQTKPSARTLGRLLECYARSPTESQPCWLKFLGHWFLMLCQLQFSDLNKSWFGTPAVVQQTTCPAFCVAAAGKYDASEQHKIHSLDAGYFVDNHLGPNLRDKQLTSSSESAHYKVAIGGQFLILRAGEGTFLTYYEPDEALSQGLGQPWHFVERLVTDIWVHHTIHPIHHNPSQSTYVGETSFWQQNIYWHQEHIEQHIRLHQFI